MCGAPLATVPGMKSASDGSFCFQWNDAAIAKIEGISQHYIKILWGRCNHTHTAQHSFMISENKLWASSWKFATKNDEPGQTLQYILISITQAYVTQTCVWIKTVLCECKLVIFHAIVMWMVLDICKFMAMRSCNQNLVTLHILDFTNLVLFTIMLRCNT